MAYILMAYIVMAPVGWASVWDGGGLGGDVRLRVLRHEQAPRTGHRGPAMCRRTF